MPDKAAPDSQIEELDAPTWELFDREYVDKNKPVLIRNVVDKWPAFSKWTPDYLKQVAGDQLVEVSFSEHGDHGTAHRRVREQASAAGWRRAIGETYPVAGVRQKMAFGELLDRVYGDPPDTRYFLSTHTLAWVSEKLLDDLDTDEWINGGNAEAKIFLGHDAFTPQHYHGAEEAFLSLISGRKRVELYSPDQIPYLYPYPWYTPMLNLAQVDVRNPDLEAFPRFKRAKPLIVDLEPGDLLFIPLHWFHAVSSLDAAIGVTWFWTAKLKNYQFPTPSFQLYANRYLAPVTISVNLRKAMRFLRSKTPFARRDIVPHRSV